MFCSQCGKEINENARFCSDCGKPVGEKISSIPSQTSDESVAQPVKKERHVIISIWLITGLVLSIIGEFCCVLFLAVPEIVEDWTIVEFIINLIYFLVLCVVYIGFLNWSKAYFKILCGASALYIYFSIKYTDDSIIPLIIGEIVLIILTYLILQLKKNDKSAWEQMSLEYMNI